MARNMLTYNLHEGHLEAMVHGYRDGLLRMEEYNSLCQCDTLQDLKSQLQVSDYGDFLQQEGLLTARGLVDRAQGVLLRQFRELQAWSEPPLSEFLDFVTYEYKILNILKLVTAKRSGRASLEFLTKCHPLGTFPEMPTLVAATDVREMFEAVLVDSPVSRFFSSEGSFERDLDELPVEFIQGTLLKNYYDQFYDLCDRLGGTTREVMCPLLDFEADRMVLTFIINTLGMREITPSDRRKVFPNLGTLVDIHYDLAECENVEQLRERLRRFPDYYQLLDDNRSIDSTSKKSLERSFVEYSVSLYNDAMTRQFQYGVFYAYVKLKELEINNLRWISDCVVQQMRNRLHEYALKKRLLGHTHFLKTMKSILSKLSGRLKTKKKRAIAPCDCTDFLEAVEFPPSVKDLRDFVRSSRFTNGIGENAIIDIRREHGVHSIAFDLRYRCGGEGRCICAGTPSCRFPTCFTMRPFTKGAEVQSERYSFESKDSTNQAIHALIELARQDQLEKAVEGIKKLVDLNLKKAAGGRRMSAALEMESDTLEGFIPGASKTGSMSSHSGVNPLSETEELQEEVISLYLWRAALLVNLRCDDAAVNSLLNLANALPPTQRTRLYEAAGKWAVLNDMEIIYYRALLGQYRSFPQAEFFARERPLLLQKVFECVKHDDFHTRHCASVVLSKEVMSAVSRMQAAQTYGDLTEDPMKSLCFPLTIPYYRFRVGDAFWKHFLNLLCMPPLPAPDLEAPNEGNEFEKPSSTNLMMGPGLMPHYIFDAVGRGMLLHHLIVFADTREREIDSGAVVDCVNRLKARGEEVHPSTYDHVLSAKDMKVAVGRLREFLVVSNRLRGRPQEEIGEGRGGEKPESLDPNKDEERTQLASSAVEVDASRASIPSRK